MLHIYYLFLRKKILIPREINYTNMLDVFKAFYLNRYIDYHTFETLS